MVFFKIRFEQLNKALKIQGDIDPTIPFHHLLARPLVLAFENHYKQETQGIEFFAKTDQEKYGILLKILHPEAPKKALANAPAAAPEARKGGGKGPLEDSSGQENGPPAPAPAAVTSVPVSAPAAAPVQAPAPTPAPSQSSASVATGIYQRQPAQEGTGQGQGPAPVLPSAPTQSNTSNIIQAIPKLSRFSTHNFRYSWLGAIVLTVVTFGLYLLYKLFEGPLVKYKLNEFKLNDSVTSALKGPISRYSTKD